MTLERHQALAEIEAALDRHESLMEFRTEYVGSYWDAPQTAIPCDSRPFDPEEAVSPSLKPQNPYPSVFGPVRIWPSGTRTQDLLPTPCARCLHSLNFQPFPLLHTLT